MLPLEYVDIGVNFHSPQIREVTAELLARAHIAGVRRVLATGTSLSGSQAALAVATAERGVWATAGGHPHGAKDFDAFDPSWEALWGHPRVVAVGECGLDYNRMFSPKAEQRAAFEAQLEAAVRLGKPLFLHCRDAFEEFHAMLKNAAAQGAHGVVHCFTGTVAEAEAYLALGFDIGITGWVADPNRGQDLRAALAVIPFERMHLETDAPYLRPKNAKKTRAYNEPALLPYVAEAVAGLKQVSIEDVARHATANSIRLFHLDCNQTNASPL